MRQTSVQCTEACNESWDKLPYNEPRPAAFHETSIRTMHRGLQWVTRQTSVQCTEAGTEGLKYKAKTQDVFASDCNIAMKRVPGLCLMKCDRVFWVGGAPCFETVCCLHYNGKRSARIKSFWSVGPLKKKATRSQDTSVIIYQSTRRNVPGHLNLY